MGKKSKNKKDFSALLEMTAFLLIALFFCLTLSSCKKKKEQKLSTHTELSQKVEDLQKNAAWAYEIESERLSKKISTMHSISKAIPLNPLTMIALEGGHLQQGVFPELEDFANLDTTNIQGEVFDTVNDFCNALIKYTSKKLKDSSEKDDSSELDAFFTPKTLYSLVLFLADTTQVGEFKKFIIGKPFISEDSIEVPIRFTCEGKILYTMVYLVLSDNRWKIHQIEIYKEE